MDYDSICDYYCADFREIIAEEHEINQMSTFYQINHYLPRQIAQIMCDYVLFDIMPTKGQLETFSSKKIAKATIWLSTEMKEYIKYQYLLQFQSFYEIFEKITGEIIPLSKAELLGRLYMSEDSDEVIDWNASIGQL